MVYFIQALGTKVVFVVSFSVLEKTVQKTVAL